MAVRITVLGDPDVDPVAVVSEAGAGDPTRIGITGHSDLTASSLPIVAAALRGWLSTQAVPPWVGVSCLACGADQLFARLALEIGAGLEVILPATDYRARKVAPADAVEFDRLLAAATSVTVLDFDRSSREAYMAASDAVLHTVDLVVAVWDGQPARRHGSTGDVVAAARVLGLPLSILWPAGAVRHPPDRPCSQVGLVLAGLVFPAQRWEIMMFAEHYGADRFTRQRLADLPEGRYRDLAAVTTALAHDPA